MIKMQLTVFTVSALLFITFANGAVLQTRNDSLALDNASPSPNPFFAVCVPGKTSYQNWAGSVVYEDCQAAWARILAAIQPAGGVSVKWTFWYDKVPQGTYIRKAPLQVIYGKSRLL